jgi:hypothetical protein
MLGDLDLMQCGKDAPTMRRLSVELTGHGNSNSKDIPHSNKLRRVSTSSVSSARSSMSQDGVLSPTFSSSLPNAFYLDRVTSLLGRASSLPMDRAGQALPSIPTSPALAASASTVAAAAAGAMGSVHGSPPRPLAFGHSSGASPVADALGSGRASALIRSLSKGMDTFR